MRVDGVKLVFYDRRVSDDCAFLSGSAIHFFRRCREFRDSVHNTLHSLSKISASPLFHLFQTTCISVLNERGLE